MFRRAPLVPIVSVESASRRGGVVLPRENFDALATSRMEKVLSPFLAKLVAPQPGREDGWLPFQRVDGSTHFLNRAGANGLPTLIPRFIANNLSVGKPCEYSCDVRPSPEILFKYYLRSA